MGQTALNTSTSLTVRCIVSKGPHAGQSFTFTQEKITIGRGAENDVVLMNDPLVSRVHCQLLIANGEVEVQNLSQKNTVIVEGEAIQRWKLLDKSFFSIGDSEITLEIDNGGRVTKNPATQSDDADRTNVISIQPVEKKTRPEVPPKKHIEKKSAAPAPTMKTSHVQAHPAIHQMGVPGVHPSMSPQAQLSSPHQMPSPHQMQQNPFSARDAKKLKDPEKPYAFYIIIGIIVVAAAFLFRESNSPKQTEKQRKASTLKYEDEVAIRLNSKTEREREAELKKKYELKNSPMALRAQENFIKGMREFQLGQFSRAQEFFQVTLNLHPGHELASKYLKLSQIRFDEVLKAKLMLGESSYQKHNFGMCAAQYQQVMNMLEGRNRDETYRLAESMYQKCYYALQGIR